MSPLTASPRVAVNPPNAMLNYLYAVLEAEARLALASLGLDPGIGMLHRDLRSRDSLACDVMEPVRPQVDVFLLDWLRRSPLKREWFFEQRNGNCRLMAPFAAKLSESAEIWRRAVAPFAEGIARALWTHTQDSRKNVILSTLTQTRKREARGSIVDVPPKSNFLHTNLCRICGVSIKPTCKHCRDCTPSIWHKNEIGQRNIPTQKVQTRDPIAQARRAETQRRQNMALKAWNPKSLPPWLDENFYRQKVQPRLGLIQVRSIQSKLSVSEPYALRIRAGKCVPHPRHWSSLSKLVGVWNHPYQSWLLPSAAIGRVGKNAHVRRAL
jgi:hypothetical protein